MEELNDAAVSAAGSWAGCLTMLAGSVAGNPNAAGCWTAVVLLRRRGRACLDVVTTSSVQ